MYVLRRPASKAVLTLRELYASAELIYILCRMRQHFAAFAYTTFKNAINKVIKIYKKFKYQNKLN